MPRFRDRDRGLRRQAPSREPKRRILVVTEGKVTEPCYFKAFQHHVRNRLVHVEIEGHAGVPLSVVKKAIELRDGAAADAHTQHDENLTFDEAWCVIDVDEHPRLDEARQIAAEAQIKMAISHPCFELWALLHFRDHAAHIERDKVREQLKTYLPKYEKELEFAALIKNYDAAVKRAVALDKAAQEAGEPGRNPSTRVYLLTETIKNAAGR